MCTLDQKGDMLRGFGFFSRIFLLFEKRKKNLRYTSEKFWVSRAIFVYSVCILQTSPDSGYKWVQWIVIIPISLPYNFHLHISGFLYYLPQSVTQLCRKIPRVVSPVLTNSTFIFIHFRLLADICFPKGHLKMSL